MTGFDSKRQMAQVKVQEEMQALYTKRQAAQAKVNDDDDTQVYADGKAAAQRPWQGLTDEDVNKESAMIASKMKLAFHAGMYVAQQILKERNT